ncbi:MAG: TPM domain-containing protein [Clostridiales Family XIII bacterium]|jgi:uncharacterized protein|nr:TPM domain-containing protein [Clostridiales Family XIII bacterium]
MKIIKQKTLRFCLLLLLLLALFAPITAFAASDGVQRFIDEENLLTAQQAAALDAKLGTISDAHDFDVAIVVVWSLEGWRAHELAAEVYEQLEYGRGADHDGAILLLAMEDRDFGFATTGYGKYAFTSVGQEYLDTLFVPLLSENDYNGAFNAFADAADDFLTQAENGTPYNEGNIPKSSGQKAMPYIISVIAGLIVALVVTLSMKAQLKSVRGNEYAAEYIRSGSMALRAQNDQFLFRNVARTQRVEKEIAKGVASSFVSSSGRGYSGHSGKF